jgi:hypothetical protein
MDKRKDRPRRTPFNREEARQHPFRFMKIIFILSSARMQRDGSLLPAADMLLVRKIIVQVETNYKHKNEPILNG